MAMLISGAGDSPDTQSHDAQMCGIDDDVFLIESTQGDSCDGELIEYPFRVQCLVSRSCFIKCLILCSRFVLSSVL